MRSTIKIALTALLALALVLALVTSLNVFKFESTLAEITRDKVDVIVDDVEQSIEAAMDLGLPLGGIGTANEILQRAKSRDPHIVDALIYGSDGVVLFSANGEAGAPVDPGWMSAQALGAGGRWSIAADGQTVFGRRLDSSYAAGVGGVAFLYSTTADAARSAGVRDELARSALAAFAIFGALALIATIIALGGMRRLIAGLVRGLGGGNVADTPLPADLVTSIRGFEGSVREAEQEIEATVPTDGRAIAGGQA